MFEATVNNKKLKIAHQDGRFYIDGNERPLDIVKTSKNTLHVLSDHTSYNVTVMELDANNKTARVKVNNHIYEVSLKDRMDILLAEMGIEGQASVSKNDIKSPMPGLILDIAVKQGMEVKKGDPLLVLEAMKMENVIKSPGDGKISAIHVSVGQSVEKNHTMIVF